MTIYFATDHAGFELKEAVLAYVRDTLGYAVHDCGAFAPNADDDYPDFIAVAAQAVSEQPDTNRAIIFGASGQGEAIVANRFKGVRAAVYYGPTPQPQTDSSGNEFSMIASVRAHNNANVLSLGARFLNAEHVYEVVETWLDTPFAGDERHVRRIAKIDALFL